MGCGQNMTTLYSQLPASDIPTSTSATQNPQPTPSITLPEESTKSHPEAKSNNSLLPFAHYSNTESAGTCSWGHDNSSKKSCIKPRVIFEKRDCTAGKEKEAHSNLNCNRQPKEYKKMPLTRTNVATIDRTSVLTPTSGPEKTHPSSLEMGIEDEDRFLPADLLSEQPSPDFKNNRSKLLPTKSLSLDIFKKDYDHQSVSGAERYNFKEDNFRKHKSPPWFNDDVGGEKLHHLEAGEVLRFMKKIC